MIDLVTVAGVVFKTSLVVVAAGLLSLALRRQSAAFGHVVWTAALALCVLMPAAVYVLPAHEVIALPNATVLPHPKTIGWQQVVLTLWLVGTSVVLLRELLTTIGLARWRRHASPLTSPHWSATLAHIGFDRRRLRVLESQHIASPCTWGVLRPVLLLPTIGDAWPESARHAALMHELAHIERRDALSNLVARLACALYWYNPLVWLAAAQIRALQERACDEAVLRGGAMPSDYAQFLLDVAARASGMSRLTRASIGMTHGSSLRARIVAILDPQATPLRPQRTRMVAACTSLFVLTMLLATITVAVEPITPVPPIPPIPPVQPITPITPTKPLTPIPPVDPTP
jgi:beta-lactamase regulating signal transducer with metallopeptidase domain